MAGITQISLPYVYLHCVDESKFILRWPSSALTVNDYFLKIAPEFDDVVPPGVWVAEIDKASLVSKSQAISLTSSWVNHLDDTRIHFISYEEASIDFVMKS